MDNGENNQKRGERIDRQNDENLYQPKIHSQRVRELHELSVSTGFPMTVLVDKAIQDFVERNKSNEGVIYEGDGVTMGEIEHYFTKAYQRGHDDGMRYLWLNVVDPLIDINIKLNRGNRKEAKEQLRSLDTWIRQNLNVPDDYERNGEGNTKGA